MMRKSEDDNYEQGEKGEEEEEEEKRDATRMLRLVSAPPHTIPKKEHGIRIHGLDEMERTRMYMSIRTDSDGPDLDEIAEPVQT